MMHTYFYPIIGLTFLAVVAFVMGVTSFLFKFHLQRRLARVMVESSNKRKNKKEVLGPRWNAVLESLSKLSLPTNEGLQDSTIHLKFIRAGIQGIHAVKIYYTIKSLLTFGVPMVIAFIAWPYVGDMGLRKFAFLLLFVATLGYYLPDIYFMAQANKHMKETQKGLPDLIDLLVICTGSGLGLDTALNRSAKEIERSYPHLARELRLINLELRAGATWHAALQHFSFRVNVEGAHSLATMLIQSSNLGTSVSDSLRIQASLMRIRRIQIAEEMMGKIPMKILLPMISCIFPALLVIVVGPAMLQIKIFLH